MAALHTWACVLLWVGLATQDGTPDVEVTCIVAEECLLPCSFQPGSKETIEWFRQEVMVYKFERKDGGDDGGASDSSEEEEEEEEEGEGEEGEGEEPTVTRQWISRGNATLHLRSSSLKDRGAYRCHALTAEGEHNAKVIVKVTAPIRGLSLELSRLSGYEEMKCVARGVYPAPRVTWATEPPTFVALRPVTRMTADKQGLYGVDSRLKTLSGQPDLVYICKVTTSYGGPAWTSSLRERVIRGAAGRDLTLPCSAPPYLNRPLLQWSFSNGVDSSPILAFDSRSGASVAAPPWGDHVELDGFRVPFGDGSLRLMDPAPAEHTGSYTCVFSLPRNTHTERSHVAIDDPVGEAPGNGDSGGFGTSGADPGRDPGLDPGLDPDLVL
ncbi:V-set domain-containing T-cell activation inhibitor 1 [Liparis tanakae]|uniref:V-set domain-containing T-cell activation inhibitor 1 n=1 Tax=Liparis tanakae TaxID=230148 RepID=A0A4Z2GJP4_9TELE|nr:V-set domain-containing T-cell activation inhibitor 1 [Liparis tanakae]